MTLAQAYLAYKDTGIITVCDGDAHTYDFSEEDEETDCE